MLDSADIWRPCETQNLLKVFQATALISSMRIAGLAGGARPGIVKKQRDCKNQVYCQVNSKSINKARKLALPRTNQRSA